MQFDPSKPLSCIGLDLVLTAQNPKPNHPLKHRTQFSRVCTVYTVRVLTLLYFLVLMLISEY